MREIPAVADVQLGCFTVWQGRTAGWTADALERAARSGRLVRARPGVYRVPDRDVDIWTRRRSAHAAQAVAAALTTPGLRISGAAAAVMHGVSLLRLPGTACVSGERWLTGQVPGMHLHRCAPSATVSFGAALCDGVARTTADVARELGVTSGVVALDHALHVGLLTVGAVQDELALMRGWPGSRRARTAAMAADGRSESVLETRSRLAMAKVGLPTPTLQASLGDAWGGFVARVDCYWDEFGVVGEVDGAVKYDGSDPDSLLREKLRQEQLADLGLEIVRWDKRGVDDFAWTAARIRRAFTRAAARPAADRRWTVLPRLALPIRGSSP